MKQYALIFRMDITTPEAQPSPEQMKDYMKSWMKWISFIAGKDQLAEGGNHFLYTGKVLKPGGIISNGPYTVNNESVAGYILVLAEHMEGAIALAEKCPILEGKGTSVEVRETASRLTN